jgi:hypothetical protein
MARARAIPHIGTPVTVVFLAARIAGVVTRVEDGARRVLVLTEEGDTVTFALSRATGTFLVDGQQSGARLLFESD